MRAIVAFFASFFWDMLLFFSLLALIAVAAASVPGCANPAHHAAQISQDIHADAARAKKAAGDASVQIAAADVKVVTAAGKPDTPPQTAQLLTAAHGDLSGAQKSLEPIAPALDRIGQKSDQQAQLTATAIKQRDAERDHWIGYKGRVTLWVLAALSPLVAIGVFIVKTNGGGPILAALGEIAGNVIGVAWSAVKMGGRVVYHVFTLGAGKLADLVNRHYDAQQATPPAPSVGMTTAPVQPSPA